MATFFGEILELQSRAVDDDEDDGEIPSLIFEKNENFEDVRCDMGIFAFGKVAIGFANSYLCSDDAILIATAKIAPPAVREDLQYSGLVYPQKAKEVARILLSSKGSKIVICEVEEDFPEQLSWVLSDYILKFCVNAAKVIVLTVFHSTAFQTDQPSGEELEFRCLATANYRKCDPKMGCPYLTQPNIIGNFPAAVISILEASNKAAVLYVCYSEINYVAAENVDIFNAFFKFPAFRNITKSSNASERFKIFLNKANLKRSSHLFS